MIAMKSNNIRLTLGRDLEKRSRESDQRIWKDVSERILASRKNRASVNIAEISRNSKDGARVLVAGKVLGAGSIEHKVTVAAFSFSEDARTKIMAAGGNCFDIGQFMKDAKSVKDVLVLG